MNHPFQDAQYDHYLLIEMSGFDSSEEAEGLLYDQMIDLFEKLEGCYDDAIICENHTQMENIWKIRETISMGTASYGLVRPDL